MALTAKFFSIADRHNVQRLLSGPHTVMTRSRMVCVAMGNECAINRLNRIDIEVANRAIQAFGCGMKKLIRAHRLV
jgi:hypothetical protein